MASDKDLHDDKPIMDSIPTQVEYSTLAKLLPSYDGNKRIALAFYIEGVENALELIANKNDYIMACLIRNNLSGNAVGALSESPGSKTWEDIKRTLQKKFGEFRTEIQLIQELMNTTRDNGSLDVFGDKIKILRNAFITMEPTRRIFYEQMALETFLDKLNPITAIHIRLKHVENLDQAITVAKREEIKFKSRLNQHNKTQKKILPNNNYSQKPYPANKKQPFPKKQTDNENQNKKKIHFQKEESDKDEESSDESDDEEESSEETRDENFLTDMLSQLET